MTGRILATRGGRWAVGLLISLAVALTACTPRPAVPAPASGTATTPTTPTTPVTTAAAATTVAPRAPSATGTVFGNGSAAGVIVPPSPSGTRYEYACAEGRTFAILAYPAAQERVTLFIEGKTLELKQERSGSGTRHSDGSYTLIAKGVEAFIEQAGVVTYRDCRATRP